MQRLQNNLNKISEFYISLQTSRSALNRASFYRKLRTSLAGRGLGIIDLGLSN
jgi:hypothetical protein